MQRKHGNIDKNFTALSLVLLFVISVLIMFRQLVSYGYFSCVVTDTYTYTGWAWQFVETLQEGVVYPRWMSHNYWGYGSPTFILYPPLAFYLTAFFCLFTDSLILAMNITKFTAIFLSGIGMYFLIKEIYTRKAALIAAIFSMILPFTVIQYYVFGGFGSTVSFFWFAPILLFIHKFVNGKGYRQVVFAGLCYGGLILTHLINAYMFTFVMVFFAVFWSIVNKRLIALFIVPLVIMVGFSVSAAYILPLIIEKKLVQLDAFVTKGSGFSYSDYFIVPHILGSSRANVFWATYYDTFVLHIILLCLIISIIVLLKLLWCRYQSPDHDKGYLFFLGLSLFTVFLLFGTSSFIWESVPYFKYIQFPVRWLHITIFAVPLLLGSFLYCMEINVLAGEKYILIVGALFLICTYFDYQIIRKSSVFIHDELFPIRTVNFSTEHMPVWVDKEQIARQQGTEEMKITIKGNGTAEVVKWKSEERVIHVKAEQPLSVRIRTFYFPGWRAYFDGQPLKLTTEKSTGAILADVPQGDHIIRLIFEDTPVRLAGKIISVVSFVLLALIVASEKLLSRKDQRLMITSSEQ